LPGIVVWCTKERAQGGSHLRRDDRVRDIGKCQTSSTKPSTRANRDRVFGPVCLCNCTSAPVIYADCPQDVVHALALSRGVLRLLHGLKDIVHAVQSRRPGLLHVAADTSNWGESHRGRRNRTIFVAHAVRHQGTSETCSALCRASVAGGRDCRVGRSSARLSVRVT